MTLEEIFMKYEKGCGCSGANPSDCKECLDAAVSAVKYWMGKDGGWTPNAEMEVEDE